MNITGNVRYRSTEEMIEKALLSLLKRKRYDAFSVKDLCAAAGINRSSFYAHYTDINDLMIKFESKLAKEMQTIWKLTDIYTQQVFVEAFKFIRKYKEFYKAFLKSNSPSFVAPEMLKRQREIFKEIAYKRGLNYSDTEIEYHLYFFGGGLKAVSGFWIQNGCKEAPEQLAEILYNEYANNAEYFATDKKA